MTVLFMSLLLISITAFMVGLSNPKLVVRWGKERGHKQVLLTYGLATILFSVLVVFTASQEKEPSEKLADRVKKNEKVVATVSAEEAPKSPMVNYRIVKVEDFPFMKAKRFVWHVVVDEPANLGQLKQVAEVILEDAKKRYKFNAIQLSFYDYPEFVEYGGYTLGRIVFAPAGDWSQATSVKAGEYRKMSIRWELQGKDWKQRLTPEEVKVWISWERAYDAEVEANPDELPDEDETTAQIAKRFNLKPNAVDAILIKKIMWKNIDRAK